ncbi:uncharacterized protein LOC104920651 isoform X2 [Larimichthys crocea]|uniref:uncharacterized protein LOC104920651 isoform X2 n=1 Tax=Larimichthys crocea TaxID=215358 RepID=UPI000F5E0301|nr:uncharacterized protein LOC104920651 isoform X2 [Larimichthys crocea]
MMENLAANKSLVPCQSWGGQTDWSTTSAQGSLFNTMTNSQHLSLGLSSEQRYNHRQASNPSCMSNIGTLSSSHHSALSNSLFASTAIPNTSHSISFAQQSPHTSSMLLTSNQGANIPPPALVQTNQARQPCRPQNLPHVPPHDPYKASVQPALTHQDLLSRLQEVPVNLVSCGQRASTSQAAFQGGNVFGTAPGYNHSQASSASQEQRQWVPSPHCREAVNKEPPQEANASNDRSALLHQRAQLLQQLAALDKLLEMVPSDDGSVGQSSHTAVQSQPHLSANCASPASYEEDSQACDAPDDPMSETEPVKKENASAVSDDNSDPNYIPNSDDDFSDAQSEPEPDRGFSDESSPSSPSTSPEKKQAKSESSSSKEKSDNPPEETRKAKLKKPSEAVVLPNSKEHCKRRNYCPFCSKAVCKMARHLESVHSDKAEVAAAFQHPKNSRDRQKIWNRLINQGNFVHNKKVLKSGKGQLAVRKRPKSTATHRDFLHCLYCRGLYMKNALPRHMKSCPEKGKDDDEKRIGKRRIQSQCVIEASDDLGVSDGFKDLLTQMTYDDVTQTVMDDKIILQFGEMLFSQHGSDVKQHDYIRQNLRQLARLVLEAQNKTQMQKLEDFFLPGSFRRVVSVVKVLAGYDSEKKSYSKPSLAIKLGYHLQKTCSIVEDNAVKQGDESLAESARSFLSLYQKKWTRYISSGALKTLRKPKEGVEKAPFAQDVKCLNSYMEQYHAEAEKKLKDTLSAENYAALAKVILARTIFFNRRRAREISLIPLTAFASRKKSNVHSGTETHLSDLERTMCKFFTRIEIRGSCGRLIPVLLKSSFVSALELLVKVRETCGVPSRNSYLFARPKSLSSYKPSDCITRYAKECGAKDPELLASAKFRQHYGTMLQVMNLDDHEADQILGPNSRLRALRQDGGMLLGDVEMNSNERQPRRGEQTASWDQVEYPSARFGSAQAWGATTDDVTVSRRSGKSGKKGSQKFGKSKWDEAEVLAVERHLMPLIKGHKVPQKSDCIRCLEAEPEALRNRSWKGIKDYVRNRITALKRQSGTYHRSYKQ